MNNLPDPASVLHILSGTSFNVFAMFPSSSSSMEDGALVRSDRVEVGAVSPLATDIGSSQDLIRPVALWFLAQT